MGISEERIRELSISSWEKFTGTPITDHGHVEDALEHFGEPIRIAVAEAVKPWKEALNRSEFDISPCRDCGLPVVCIPDGMSAWCNECARSKCDHNWVDATNQVIESGEYCTKCMEMRARSESEKG